MDKKRDGDQEADAQDLEKLIYVTAILASLKRYEIISEGWYDEKASNSSLTRFRGVKPRFARCALATCSFVRTVLLSDDHDE